MKIVLDSAILVRANDRSTGPARELLLAILRLGHQLLNSEYIVEETARVLRYPRLRKRHRMSEQELNDYVRFVRQRSKFVEPAVERPVVLADPNDDPVVYTAVAGKAEVLCTRDNHFYDANVLAFCAEHGIQVINDLDLLRLLLPKA